MVGGVPGCARHQRSPRAAAASVDTAASGQIQAAGVARQRASRRRKSSDHAGSRGSSVAGARRGCRRQPSALQPLTHDPDDGGWAERFLDEGRLRVEQPPTNDFPIGIARREEDRGPRTQLGDALGEIAPAHPRHDHVAEHQPDRPSVDVSSARAWTPFGRLQDTVAAFFQRAPGHRPHTLIVLHQEHRLAPPGPGSRSAGPGSTPPFPPWANRP